MRKDRWLFLTSVRGWVYPMIPPIVLALGVSTLGVVLRVLCRWGPFRDFYNIFVLWVVTRYHLAEPMAVCLVSGLILGLAGRIRNRASRRHDSNAGAIGLVLALLILGASAYLLGPWRLAVFSPWLALPLAAALLWLWVRASWAYIGILFPAVSQSIRAFWTSSLDGREYFDLLGRIRSIQQGRDWTARDHPAREPFLPANLSSTGHMWQVLFLKTDRLLARVSGAGRIGDLAARGLCSMLPSVPEALAAEDLMLVAELDYLARSAWADVERELYVVGSEEALGEDRRALIRRYFYRWWLMTNAQVGCHVFDFAAEDRGGGRLTALQLGQSARGRRTIESVRAGVDLLAASSRRVFLPTLRGGATTDENPLGLFWWDEDGLLGAFRLAADWVDREIEALVWLAGRDHGWDQDLDSTNLVELCDEARASDDPWKSLICVRLALGCVVRWGLRIGLSEDGEGRQRIPSVPASLWFELKGVIAEKVRTILFPDGRGVDPELSTVRGADPATVLRCVPDEPRSPIRGGSSGSGSLLGTLEHRYRSGQDRPVVSGTRVSA